MQGDSWIGRILIGGIIGFLSILFFPIFIFVGYLVRVLESTINGDPEPPEWDDWGGLFVDGIKATIVGIAYSIIPTVVILGLGSVFVGIGAAAGDGGGGILAGFGLITMLLLIPVFFLVYYLVPAALANMAAEGTLGAAFDFGMIRNVVLTGDYLVAVLMPIVVGIAINIVTSILAITVVGLVLVPFVNFYGQVAVFRMFGLAFAKQANKGGNQPHGTTVTA